MKQNITLTVLFVFVLFTTKLFATNYYVSAVSGSDTYSSFANKLGGTSTITSVPLAGSSTNVGKATITNLPAPASSDNIQLSTNVFLVKDRNYLISFKASADTARAISVRILQNTSPFSTIFTKAVNITTAQVTYGTYAYTSTYTGSVALRFFLGNSSIATYFDDVVMTEEATATLPVTLLSFTGSLSNNKAVLNWTTSSEINAKEFVIEKSLDGSTFTGIGIITALNTAGTSNYTFTDNGLQSGQVFYRLKLVDKDGSSRYSYVINFRIGESAATQIKLFPNPATTFCSVFYPLAIANASLSIYMADGKKVTEYNIATGSTQRSIDVSGLARGHYFIVYKYNSETISTSFVK